MESHPEDDDGTVIQLHKCSFSSSGRTEGKPSGICLTLGSAQEMLNCCSVLNELAWDLHLRNNFCAQCCYLNMSWMLMQRLCGVTERGTVLDFAENKYTSKMFKIYCVSGKLLWLHISEGKFNNDFRQGKKCVRTLKINETGLSMWLIQWHKPLKLQLSSDCLVEVFGQPCTRCCSTKPGGALFNWSFSNKIMLGSFPHVTVTLKTRSHKQQRAQQRP